MAPASTILSLDEAVSEIVQACPIVPEGGTARPFAFVVGAGISFPPVPLAGRIELECREIAETRGIKPLPGSPTAMERYSHWFGKAYSQPILRQQYLENLIEGRGISLANFRLAHLLRAKCVANVVITPNFDNLLSRALATFGHDSFRVCDHPKTVHRISLKRPEVQIVHVHGNHWSYDQANLSGELEAASAQSSTSTLSMALLLDAILRELSPIVVGYSGWEGDVIMKALLRRNPEANPYKSYWFCHRRTDIDSLPPWLKSRQDFVFILPAEPQTTERPPSTETSRTGTVTVPTPTEGAPAPRLAQPPIAQASIQETVDRNDRLEASTVFDRLIVALGVEPPPLFRDPLEFFAQRLEESVPKDMRLPGGAGAYQFGEVIEKIRRAQKSLMGIEKSSGKIREAEAVLGEVRDAIRGSRYEDALKAASRISVGDLGETERRALAESLSLAVRNVDPKFEYTLPSHDLLINLATTLSESSPSHELDLMLVDALLAKSSVLWLSNRFEDAIAVNEVVLARFGSSQVAAMQEQVAKALHNKALSLNALNRGNEAILVYDEIVRRFADSAVDKVLQEVARALLAKGYSLGELGRSEDAVSVYDHALKLFGSSSFFPIQEQVAKSLVNKGYVLETMARYEDALQAYDEAVHRFGASSSDAVLEPVARALLQKGSTLRGMNRNPDAIAAYDEIVRRFGDSTFVELQTDVAWALYSKGSVLSAQSLNEEALAAYEELIRRFGGSTAPAVQASVGWALYYKGSILSGMNRTDEAIAAIDELVRRFGGSSDAAAQEILAWGLYNKGLTLENLNRDEEAIAAYDESVRRVGGSTTDAVLDPLARSLLKKGALLHKLSRNSDAIVACDEVSRRLGNPSSSLLQEHVANSLSSKVTILAAMGQKTEAARICDELIQKFGSSTESNITSIVAKAQGQRDALSST